MNQHSRTSSIYSSETSSKKPLHLETRMNAFNGSNSRPSSRATSYTPSYMSNLATKAPSGQRSSPMPISQTPTRTAPEPTVPPPTEPAGALMIFSPGQLHPSLLFYVEILLDRQAFSSIVFAANKTQEAELKQLRMDAFALLGKMRREVAVSMDTRDQWTRPEIEDAIQSFVKSGQGLQGVLCCLEQRYDSDVPGSVLDMDESELEDAWKRSVGFLHTMSRTTLPHLLSNSESARPSNGTHAKASAGPLLLVTQPPVSSEASQISKVSFDTLMTKLQTATRSKGLTVGYAEDVLVPRPRPATPQTQDQPLLQPYAYSVEDHGFTPSESPTKLWNMWALVNDTPTFDS